MFLFFLLLTTLGVLEEQGYGLIDSTLALFSVEMTHGLTDRFTSVLSSSVIISYYLYEH